MSVLGIYQAKSLLILKTLFSKNGITLLPLVITMPFLLNTTEKAIGLLIILMIVDFATGIGASISKTRAYHKKFPKEEKQRIISSEKLRKSGVKFLLYSMTILTSAGLQYVFGLETFEVYLIKMPISLTIGVILFWCIVELYSIFFENFKDMGVDIKSIFAKITGLIKFAKTKISDII